MTRETDSSSSGPQGRGGAAYPSGTPPYGSRPFPSLHPQERTRPQAAPDEGTEQRDPAQGDPAGQPAASAEPRTETTLTTRIRINIPGSRPIPPVVVRTPVDESAAAEPAAQAAAEPEVQAPAEPEPEVTSDWFAPRKPPAAQPPAAPPPGLEEPTGGIPLPFGEGAAPGPGRPPLGGAPAAPFGRDGSTGAAPLPIREPGAAVPSPGLTPPGSPFGAQGDESTGSTPYLPPPVGPVPGEDEAARGPHDASGDFAVPFANEAPPFGAGSPFDPGAGAEEAGAPPFDAGSPFGTGTGPEGSAGTPPFGTGSPFDTGAMPPVQADDRSDRSFDTAAMPAVPADDDGPSPYDTGSQAFGTADFPPGVPRPGEQPLPGGEDPLRMPYDPPAGPTAGAMGATPLPPEATRPPAAPGGFRPAPPPGPGAGDGPLSGDTLVSGIPAVPSGDSRPGRQAPPRAAAPAPDPVPDAPAPARPVKKKGRSIPVLLVVAVGGIVVLAYGAGLLMNHADVPKNTTVLGVDIGNQNRDAAVKMLDTALGNRATAPVQLTIGGKKESLKPSVAGLSIDTDATVREVAHADYNPVSVIGSLFGGSRTSDPVFVIDEDKLKVALQSLADKGGPGSDAMVRFDDGKAVGVPGKPRQTLDVAAAASQVEAAYRARATTGANTPVSLAATTAPPTVSQAELDKAVNGFGETAMSDFVTVEVKGGPSISFSPHGTVPKFLTMRATPDGKLAPHIDLDTLQSLYGQTFSGVLLKRADGSKTPVTPDDVAKALIKALGATKSVDRTVDLSDVS